VGEHIERQAAGLGEKARLEPPDRLAVPAETRSPPDERQRQQPGEHGDAAQQRIGAGPSFLVGRGGVSVGEARVPVGDARVPLRGTIVLAPG